LSYVYKQNIGWFMVFNATFNNISVILWRSVLLVEETRVPEESHDLSQVTDKLHHIKLHHVQPALTEIVQVKITNVLRGRRGRDHMVVGFRATSAISAYHH
jgi:hypothetical protein